MYCNEFYTFVGRSNLTSFYNLVWKRTSGLKALTVSAIHVVL